MAEIGVKSKRLHTNVKVATKKEEQTIETRETQTDAFRQYTPSTCFTQRSAYFRVFSVVDLLLCLLSAGRWSFSSFRVLITSFCVLALADSSLLQVAHIHAQRRVRQGKQSLRKRLNNRHNSWLCYYVRCSCGPKSENVLWSDKKLLRLYSNRWCIYLQPLVEGLSCSELSRLKAFELLGGDGLWEFELCGKRGQGQFSLTLQMKVDIIFIIRVLVYMLCMQGNRLKWSFCTVKVGQTNS